MRRFAVTLVVAAVPALVALGQPLPTDPRLVTGSLDNGLSYILLKHDNPPGRAAMWLHVSSGSLNETDKQRGIAHYLEHMAFNGSANFPPGSVVPLFESFGMTFGRDQNAFTSFEQTTYQLSLPNTQAETIGKGLLFLSDVAFRQSLLPNEIEAERQVIKEEKRARSGSGQRIQDYIFARIAPGSLIGERIPIGTEETLSSVQKADFEDYYKRWYLPSNMTLLVVADMEPAGLIEQIKAQFGGGPKAARPVDQDPKVTPYDSTRAIIATDPEITRGSIAITRIDRADAATTTVPQLRARMVERIGSTAFNRRMDAKINAGGPSFLDASASIQNMFQAAKMIQISADGKPENWKTMLSDVATELQRARLHGFTGREVDDVKTQILSSAEESVKREPTLSARQVLGMLNRDVAQGEPTSSAEQELDILKSLLPGIKAEEVSARFAELTEPKNVTFILELPSSTPAPTEAELVSIGTAALNVKPEKDAESARAGALLSKLPEGGAVAEQSEHAASGVWSGWLSNGVRVHEKSMDYKKDEVTVSITLAGGTIQETAENRGVTAAAMLAWNRPATGTLSSTQIRDLMTGKKVRVGGGGGRMGPGGLDTLTLSVSGNPADLETGMQAAYLLLTDPVIEPAAFDQWKTEELQGIEAREKDPQAAFGVLLPETIYPRSEARLQPLTAAQVNAVTREMAQAWLRKLIATAPIEVSVVGDLPRERAVELVSRYLGSLPKRERIGEGTLDDLRAVKRPVGPINREKSLATKTPAAIVMSGFFGPDADNVPDVRAMELASRIISTRMVKSIREEKNLVYSINAQLQPSRTIPGFGMFFAAAPTKPEHPEALRAAISEEFAKLAQGGPSEDEMIVARKQIANTLDESMKEPRFWLGATSAMDYRGVKLDDVVGAPEAFEAITAEQVKAVFAKYCRQDAMISVTLRPQDAEAAEAPAKP